MFSPRFSIFSRPHRFERSRDGPTRDSWCDARLLNIRFEEDNSWRGRLHQNLNKVKPWPLIYSLFLIIFWIQKEENIFVKFFFCMKRLTLNHMSENRKNKAPVLRERPDPETWKCEFWRRPSPWRHIQIHFCRKFFLNGLFRPSAGRFLPFFLLFQTNRCLSNHLIFLSGGYEGQKSEGKCLLRWWSCWHDRGWCCGKAQMSQDLLDGWCHQDGGNDFHLPATARTGVHLDLETLFKSWAHVRRRRLQAFGPWEDNASPFFSWASLATIFFRIFGKKGSSLWLTKSRCTPISSLRGTLLLRLTCWMNAFGPSWKSPTPNPNLRIKTILRKFLKSRDQ